MVGISHGTSDQSAMDSSTKTIFMRCMKAFKGICMVNADSHVVRDQFNKESPKSPAFCSRGPLDKRTCCRKQILTWPLMFGRNLLGCLQVNEQVLVNGQFCRSSLNCLNS